MQCPKCKAENPMGTRQCAACGAKLPRRRRKSRVAADAAAHSWLHSTNRVALGAYRCSLLSMVPFFGLVLGPLAVLLGMWGRRRERRQASERGAGQSVAAIVLGTATMVTNWLGLVFILRGLH